MTTYNPFIRLFSRLSVTICLGLFLVGCSATISDYKSTTPEFDMKTFFDGKLAAYGMVQNRNGEVIRRFRADLIGSWEGNKGLLEEDFFYDDGETQRRVWNLVKHGNNQYSGVASDSVGEATGESQGFAFNWRYTLAIEVDGTTWDIDLNDWIYQLDDSRLINQTEMKTFFDGKLAAYGMVQNRNGEVIRRFRADLIGSWEGNKGLLEEDFFYDDGETQRRVWNLVKHGNNQYSGVASDSVGEATGESQGFAFNWRYTLAIEVDGTTWDIDLNDWIYQLDDSRLINQTEMTKWGFNVGQITLIIEKIE